MSGLFSRIPNDSFDSIIITDHGRPVGVSALFRCPLRNRQKKCRNRGTVSAISGKGLRRWGKRRSTL